MIIPEKEKGVRSVRIPRNVFRALSIVLAAIIILLFVMIYDYQRIHQEIYTNKHLTIENRQLKEQVQLFQMKLNTLGEDIERIRVFEKKIKVITGLDQIESTTPFLKMSNPGQNTDDHNEDIPPQSSIYKAPSDQTTFETFKNSDNFKKIRSRYEQKMAASFGLSSGYQITKEWSELTRQSFLLAEEFAQFDYRYNGLLTNMEKLEIEINNLDESLLGKESFLKSTPSLMPAQGWITSYYGPRVNPVTGKLKMHEGLDIGSEIGKLIIAPADALVTFSGHKAGFGNFLELDHGYGIETVYAHADRLLVRKGERVKRGVQIAKVGNTGYSTGPHLHYEVRINGTPVDPMYYILD
jgi:murein DD-endopeptidase MepM/ murein hydrolase activator NlpD